MQHGLPFDVSELWCATQFAFGMCNTGVVFQHGLPVMTVCCGGCEHCFSLLWCGVGVPIANTDKVDPKLNRISIVSFSIFLLALTILILFYPTQYSDSTLQHDTIPSHIILDNIDLLVHSHYSTFIQIFSSLFFFASIFNIRPMALLSECDVWCVVRCGDV